MPLVEERSSCFHRVDNREILELFRQYRKPEIQAKPNAVAPMVSLQVGPKIIMRWVVYWCNGKDDTHRIEKGNELEAKAYALQQMCRGAWDIRIATYETEERQ